MNTWDIWPTIEESVVFGASPWRYHVGIVGIASHVLGVLFSENEDILRNMSLQNRSSNNDDDDDDDDDDEEEEEANE